MAQFQNMIITRAGLDMIAQSQAGGTLIFTKGKLGDGQIGEQSIPDLTDLISSKMSVELSTVTAKSEGHVEVRFVVDNTELDVGFFVREVGIFAKVNEEGVEQLYGYANAGNYTNYLADKTVPIDSIITKIDLVVGNASSVAFTTDKSIVYVTLEDMENALTGHDNSVDAHEPAFNAHNEDVNAHKAMMNEVDPIVQMDESAGTITATAYSGTKYAFHAGLNILARNKAYAYGDIAYSPNLPSWAYLYCVTAGTTAAVEPSFASVTKMGQYITDGTAKWIVDDVRFGLPVGVVFYDKKLRPGCVKINGATVNRADYIRPFHEAVEDDAFYDKDDRYTFTGTTTASGTTITGISAEDIGKLQTAKEVCGDGILITGTGIPEDCMIDEISTDSVTITVAATAAGTVKISYGNIHNYPYLYGWGDGETTFVLPDYRARVIQGGEQLAVKKAALPNITGRWRSITGGTSSYQGAFYAANIRGTFISAAMTQNTDGVLFDASKCSDVYSDIDTVQPPAINCIAQAKI